MIKREFEWSVCTMIKEDRVRLPYFDKSELRMIESIGDYIGHELKDCKIISIQILHEDKLSSDTVYAIFYKV